MTVDVLEVLDGGLLTTIQDGGRPDWTHLGVTPSGACDPLGLAVANLLLDNGPDAAALELTIAGPVLRTTRDVVIALGGADLGGHVRAGGRRLAPGRSHRLAAGEVVAFPGSGDGRAGARAYLALPGGVDVPRVLGSRSTCLPGGFGGLGGRALGEGDRIAAVRTGSTEHRLAGRAWPVEAAAPVDAGAPIRLIAGPRPGAEVLASRTWRVAAGSDRVGLRLEGGPLGPDVAGEVASHGVAWGAVQVPPDGRPIVLLADGGTTGGYPVVGVAISADRPRLGQLRPGADVTFEIVDQAAARAALAGLDEAVERGRATLREAAGWDELAGSAGG